MVERCKEYLNKNFSNSPKAKLVLVTAVAGAIVLITFINMRKTVILNIDGEEETFITYKGTVKNVLEQKEIQLDKKDSIQPELGSKISENSTIFIERAVPVKLVTCDKVVEIYTVEDTIADMLEAEKEELESQGIEYNEDLDEINLAKDTEITKDLEIQLIKVDIKEDVVKETIDFEVLEETDSNMDISVEKVTQEGSVGEKEVTYEVVYKDGEEFSREIKASKVLAEPINKVIVRGTRKTFASRDGQILDYKKLIYCESTAYYGDGITATGTVPVRNPGGISTIAVDPRVIPLGSLVYVDGYGKAIASDTGGVIKGNIIDVFVNSHHEAYNLWGRKYNVPVYILAYPGEW